ncbi:MAG: translocation/assembly module TamB domain-containing protein, partial [Acidobacteriota bacterium]
APGFSARYLTGAMHLTTEAAQSLRLELGDGDEALLVRGEMPFVPTPTWPITLAFDSFDWPLSEVRPWLDFDLPVDGLISGHLDLQVDDVASYGELEADVSPATLSLSLAAGTIQPADSAAGVTPSTLLADVDSVAGQLAWDANQIRFDRLKASAPSGSVDVAGTMDWTSGALDLLLRSPALQLSKAPLRHYLPRDDIDGKVRIDGRLGGSLNDPRLDLAVFADRLALGQRALEGRPSRLDVQWSDGRFEAAGRLLELVTLSGGGILDAARTDLKFLIDGNDLRGLAELLLESPPETLEGRFDGTLSVRGEGDERAAIDLLLAGLEVELGERSLVNLEPVRARLEAENVLIHSLHLGEEATATDFDLSGTLGYTAPTSLDLDLKSTVSGIWLELLDFGFDVQGSFDLAGKLAGTFDRPTFEGTGELSDGQVLLSEDLPLELHDLAGNLTFQPGQVVLDRLEGRMGRGHIALEGQATLEPDQPPIYRVQLTGTDLDIRNLEGWAMHGAMQLSLASAGDGHLLDGRAELESLSYTEDIRADFAQLMRSFLQRQRLEVEPMDSLLSLVELNIDIEAPGTVRVDNNVADFTGSAQLLLRGDLAQPVLFGDAEIDPDGTLIYNSTDYEIERGRVVFANPYELDPEIDLVAVTRVREFDITLAVDGTFDRLATRFSSEPPLPDLEVFRLLTSGGDAATDSALITPQRTEVEEDPSTSAATFLYGQAASVIGQRVNNLFGFDKFRIDPLTGSGDQLSKARVTVGKRLSKDVLITFSADPSSTEDQRWRLEWQVSPGLVLVLTQNGDESYSADARWETSF